MRLINSLSYLAVVWLCGFIKYTELNPGQKLRRKSGSTYYYYYYLHKDEHTYNEMQAQTLTIFIPLLNPCTLDDGVASK